MFDVVLVLASCCLASLSSPLHPLAPALCLSPNLSTLIGISSYLHPRQSTVQTTPNCDVADLRVARPFSPFIQPTLLPSHSFKTPLVSSLPIYVVPKYLVFDGSDFVALFVSGTGAPHSSLFSLIISDSFIVLLVRAVVSTRPCLPISRIPVFLPITFFTSRVPRVYTVGLAF